MNYKLLITFAALAFIIASCTKDELKPEQPHTFTITASMPDDGDHLNAVTGTRMTFAPSGTDNKGITATWTETDKLYLRFTQGSKNYMTQAPIIASSISGKTAGFTVTLPDASTAFDPSAQFSLSAYFQEDHGETVSGAFFQLTLQATQERSTNLTGDHRIRPFMRYKSDALIGTGDLATVNMQLEHQGYVVALHVHNSSGVQQTLPVRISIGSTTQFTNPTGTWSVATDEWLNNVDADGYIRFNTKTADTDPGISIASDETAIIYRWAYGNTEDTPSLNGSFQINYSGSGKDFTNSGTIPAKTGLLKKGTCVHLYVTYDGTDMAFGR